MRTNTNTNTHTHTHTHTHTTQHTHTHTQHPHTNLLARTHSLARTHTHTHARTCSSTCLCTHMHARTRTRAHTHTLTRTHTHSHTHTLTHTHSHTHINTHFHIHSKAYVLICTQAHIHACIIHLNDCEINIVEHAQDQGNLLHHPAKRALASSQPSKCAMVLGPNGQALQLAGRLGPTAYLHYANYRYSVCMCVFVCLSEHKRWRDAWHSVRYHDMLLRTSACCPMYGWSFF